MLPQVYETDQSVSFTVICADHDAPICFAQSMDVVATDRLSMLRGNPAGYYALGRIDSMFTVLNTTDPTNPTIIKRIEAPWSKRRGTWYYYCPDSYAFDDQYLYAALFRGPGNPWSALYVFDLFSPSAGPVYSIGDMELGQWKMGSLASWGRYLYYFDKVRDDRDYHRLQIFEKARACDPNLQVAIGPDPIASGYEVGQNVKISWHCVGCPTRIDIKLLEDGSGTETIASLKKFDQPNLAANTILWPAHGISANPNSHLYCLQILAWNIEGKYAECYSNSFQIVDVIEHGGKGPAPIVDASMEGGKKESYPLPGFATIASERQNLSYWMLPDNTEVVRGEIALNVRTSESTLLSVSTMDLITIDAPNDYRVLLSESRPMLKNGGKEVIPVLPLLYGSEEKGSPNVTLPAARRSAGIAPDELITILPNESHRFTFRIPQRPGDGARHYVLRYGGLLIDSSPEGGPIPKAFALKDPYPNPFNPSTVIEFDAPREAAIDLTVYDVAGRFIRNLKAGRCKAGVYRVTWDGCDSHGSIVASGMYFCRLTIDNAEYMTTKLILLR